jgi:ubiquinone/menaquinone biosynthesis C-methylase UbiE
MNMVETIEELDWNEMWKEAMQNSSFRKRRQRDRTEFWDKRAKGFNESIKRNDRAERIIAKLDIKADDTVLDIGAGPGTLAIPLAKMVKQVTAIDPSKGMLACLKENAVTEGLKNITCINKKWENVAIGRDMGKHDIVIASHSLVMLDIHDAISKMNDVATRFVYIFTFAGRRFWDYDELWLRLFGEEFQPGPDYIYLYNVLYEMGIHANVEIIKSEHNQRFSNLSEAVERWMENLDVSSPEAEVVIRSYLSEKLVVEDGALGSTQEMNSAMIWWKKNRKS